MRETEVERYGPVAQAFHWLVAGLIFLMLGLGYYMEDRPDGGRKLELYGIHKSIGITIAVLAALRLGWRLFAHRRRCPPACGPGSAGPRASWMHCSA